MLGTVQAIHCLRHTEECDTQFWHQVCLLGALFLCEETCFVRVLSFAQHVPRMLLASRPFCDCDTHHHVRG